MVSKTPFNQSAVTPQPFQLGLIPVHNLTPVPHFLQPGYVNGTTPEALPPVGFHPVTARTILSGIFPKQK